jgi:hypothetical protein
MSARQRKPRVFCRDQMWHPRLFDPAEFESMSLSSNDLNALVAFLLSLTEDYDDA